VKWDDYLKKCKNCFHFGKLVKPEGGYWNWCFKFNKEVDPDDPGCPEFLRKL